MEEKTDRELLELAAKAAGVEYAGEIKPDDGRWFGDSGLHGWNPLTNDGDALRLVVKLKLAVTHYGDVVTAGPWALDQDAEEWTGLSGADPYAATRRAIVRAAAALASKGDK